MRIINADQFPPGDPVPRGDQQPELAWVIVGLLYMLLVVEGIVRWALDLEEVQCSR